jgi:hypothetical protein
MADIKDLSSKFPNSEILKRTLYPHIILAAVSVNLLDLSILKADLARDHEKCFPEGQIYFRISDGAICKIFSEQIYGGEFRWKVRNKKTYQTIEIDDGFMKYARIELDEKFYYGRLVTELVTEIVLVITDWKIDQKDALGLEEAQLVKEFES